MSKWLGQPWVIFLVTLTYSYVAFDLYWAHGPRQLGLTVGGSLIWPVIYGLLWLVLGGNDSELGLRALVGSGAWVSAALFIY
jgi:hypothetical protein